METGWLCFFVVSICARKTSRYVPLQAGSAAEWRLAWPRQASARWPTRRRHRPPPFSTSYCEFRRGSIGPDVGGGFVGIDPPLAPPRPVMAAASVTLAWRMIPCRQSMDISDMSCVLIPTVGDRSPAIRRLWLGARHRALRWGAPSSLVFRLAVAAQRHCVADRIWCSAANRETTEEPSCNEIAKRRFAKVPVGALWDSAVLAGAGADTSSPD